MNHLFVLILMLIGGLGFGLALWYPAARSLTSDQHIGFGLGGIAWLIACFALAMSIH